MFESGDEMELPVWCDELATRRQLWQEYGLALGEWNARDVMRAIRFSNALAKHIANKVKKK